MLRANRVTGLDKSPSFIEEAARTPVANVVYQVGDVNRSHDEVVPDVPPADALYSRFLLTHLPNPQQALSMWASYVTDGAVCLLQETAAIPEATLRSPATTNSSPTCNDVTVNDWTSDAPFLSCLTLGCTTCGAAANVVSRCRDFEWRNYTD